MSGRLKVDLREILQQSKMRRAFVDSIGSKPWMKQQLLAALPHAKSVTITDVNDDASIPPGKALVVVRLKWYAWLAFGLLHRATRREAERIMPLLTPFGVSNGIRVVLVGRRA